MEKLDAGCRLILISGGVRSGKSQTALNLARKKGEERLFIATAQAFDQEMVDRISAHRLERDDFTTFEKPVNLSEGFDRGKVWDVIVIDCLTLWLSNLMLNDHADDACESSVYRDLRTIAKNAKHLIIVSNEVGLGIVPEHALARRFRDLNGRLQQSLARSADEVYFAVMGCVVPLHMLRVEF